MCIFKLLNISSFVFAFLLIVNLVVVSSQPLLSFEQRMNLAEIDGKNLAAPPKPSQLTSIQKARANSKRNKKIAFLFSGFTGSKLSSAFNIRRRR